MQTNGISKEDETALKNIFSSNWKANGLFLVHQETENTCDVEGSLKAIKVPEWISAVGKMHQGLRNLVYKLDDEEEAKKEKAKQKNLFFEEYWTWFFKYARKL